MTEPQPRAREPAAPTTSVFGPWYPGLESRIPERLLPLCTIFRPENVFSDIATTRELRDLTGFDYRDLVAFRPQRLALHELLVRVTADLSVPDGEKIEDLGINFRRITRNILAHDVEPAMADIVSAYDAVRSRIRATIDAALDEMFPSDASGTRATTAAATGWRAWFGGRRAEPTRVDDGADRERRLVAAWETRGHASADPLQKAVFRALAKVGAALLVRHDRVWGGRDLIARLATDIACNDHGSDEVGRLIDPLVATAAARDGYVVLPKQPQPLVMNTKGASASGKSTLRPLQKKLAGDIGVNWAHFALISPDIWRKQLIDYGSLGDDYKYGGAFSGDELHIIDQKLDRYMARKAERGGMTHLLIDRFRFDSFAPDSDEAGSNLLTRFGHVVYMFFMITPPASLVERAWNRGLEVGRYKAVDDTLAHGVEAYSGMPQLFFTWVARADKRVHFEFLDNSVPQGERPRTVAFGWNDALHVLDVGPMIDVERFRRVDVDATSPAALYRDPRLLAPERNSGFLRQCLDRFAHVDFADQDTGRVYLRLAGGAPVWVDRPALETAIADADTRAGLQAVLPDLFDRPLPAPERPTFLRDTLAADQIATLGRWGTSR